MPNLLKRISKFSDILNNKLYYFTASKGLPLVFSDRLPVTFLQLPEKRIVKWKKKVFTFNKTIFNWFWVSNFFKTSKVILAIGVFRPSAGQFSTFLSIYKQMKTWCYIQQTYHSKRQTNCRNGIKRKLIANKCNEMYSEIRFLLSSGTSSLKAVYYTSILPPFL